MQMEMRNLAGSPGPTEVNALYANATKMEAIDRLPRISRHQLELASNKYLGAGAFGQVWEGLAKGLFPNEPERNLPVAMKVSWGIAQDLKNGKSAHTLTRTALYGEG